MAGEVGAVSPYIIIVALVALILTNAGSFLGGRSYEAGEHAKALYDQAVAYAGEIVSHQAALDTRERDHAQRLAEISTAHQQEITHAKIQRDRDVAAARSGTIKLWFGAQRLDARSEAGAAPGPGAGRCDGGEAGELPGETAADLLDLAHDADDIARQLYRCQQVVIEDRRLCDGG